MSYSAGETRILALIQACTGFSATNTSQSDFKMLSGGHSDHYAILRPGAFAIEWHAITSYTARYVTVLEVWQRYTDDTTTQTNLFGYVNNLFAILAYPHGGDSSMSDLTIRSAGDPKEMWTKEGGPQWLKWELEIAWDEQATVTFAG